MAYREAMMTDARKWGEAVFSDSIRMLEAEYQKTDRRDAVVQAFAELFGQWEEHTRKRQHVLASVISTAAFRSGQAGNGWHYSARNFTWMKTSWKRFGSRPVFSSSMSRIYQQ